MGKYDYGSLLHGLLSPADETPVGIRRFGDLIALANV